MDGYTRKGRYSVCWLRLSAEPLEPSPHPATWRLPGVRFEELFRSWLRARDRPAEAE